MDLDIESTPVAKYLRRAIGHDDHAVSMSHVVTVINDEDGQYRLYYLEDDALLITDEGIRLVEDIPEMLGKLHTIAKQNDTRCSAPVGHLRRAARTGDITAVELQQPHMVQEEGCRSA